jgi:DNA-binding ferritin-like protein
MESTIIWCQNIESELQKRQELRVRQAKQREENYQEELRSELERMRSENDDSTEDFVQRVEEIEETEDGNNNI